MSGIFSGAWARPRRMFAGVAVAAFGLLAFAVLYLQNTVGLEPCPMCIVQRDALLLVGLCSALAAVTSRAALWRLWGALGILAALFGAFTAARQSWLQWHPPEFATCGRDLYGLIESFPLTRAIPMIFRGSGDCSAVDWTFLGGSIANWSFICFVAAIVVIGVLCLRGGRAAPVRI